MELPVEFIARMRSILGGEFERFLNSYSKAPEKGLRVNTLKISVEDFLKISPFKLENVPWEQTGFYVSGEGLGKTIYHAAGLYYLQEPSAMCAAPKLEVKAGERVLDLCSAPGGKGTQLAQKMPDDGIIFLNEINFSRAKALSSNVERLGVKNSVVTCASPEKLAEKFENYFDKILVDAPCSGEGMFKKEPSAIPEWSLQNVAACARRQAQILESAYKMLAGGGRLVYSTCTFAPEEDEEQVSAFISNHKDCSLIETDKLYPHLIRGEGHFYAVIEKSDGVRAELPLIKPVVKDKKITAHYREWESEYLKYQATNLHLIGQTLYSLPCGMPEISVPSLRAGIRLGEFIGRFEPSHSLAMCLNNSEAECIEVNEKEAENYLRGYTLNCNNGVKGWRLVTFNGYPLGWCKVSNGVAKNKLPKGVRI